MQQLHGGASEPEDGVEAVFVVTRGWSTDWFLQKDMIGLFE